MGVFLSFLTKRHDIAPFFPFFRTIRLFSNVNRKLKNDKTTQC